VDSWPRPSSRLSVPKGRNVILEKITRVARGHQRRRDDRAGDPPEGPVREHWRSAGQGSRDQEPTTSSATAPPTATVIAQAIVREGIGVHRQGRQTRCWSSRLHRPGRRATWSSTCAGWPTRSRPMRELRQGRRDLRQRTDDAVGAVIAKACSPSGDGGIVTSVEEKATPGMTVDFRRGLPVRQRLPCRRTLADQPGTTLEAIVDDPYILLWQREDHQGAGADADPRQIHAGTPPADPGRGERRGHRP